MHLPSLLPEKSRPRPENTLPSFFPHFLPLTFLRLFPSHSFPFCKQTLLSYKLAFAFSDCHLVIPVDLVTLAILAVLELECCAMQSDHCLKSFSISLPFLCTPCICKCLHVALHVYHTPVFHNLVRIDWGLSAAVIKSTPNWNHQKQYSSVAVNLVSFGWHVESWLSMGHIQKTGCIFVISLNILI